MNCSDELRADIMLTDALENYLHSCTTKEPKLLQDLMDETRESLDAPEMMSSRISGRFLNFLVQILNARRVLEIGMFSGYASLSMAEALPEDGQLFCCEIDHKVIQFAQGFFDKSPDGEKIKILEGPAASSMKKLSGDFDFIFIDADKENYSLYYEMSLDLLRKGGVIVIDNALWSGRVLDPKSETDWSIAQLNNKIINDERVSNVLLPIRDGMNVVFKK